MHNIVTNLLVLLNLLRNDSISLTYMGEHDIMEPC